jgi:hypothetical protein
MDGCAHCGEACGIPIVVASVACQFVRLPPCECVVVVLLHKIGRITIIVFGLPSLSDAHVSLQEIRHRGDSNPCGQSPMDFESISLAARTQCHVETC